jgi:multiple sugar transport system permease protein/raffinose/stachyose/melibiose transport system permease protein
MMERVVRFPRFGTLAHAGLISYSLAILGPLSWLFLSSFKTQDEMFGAPFALPGHPALDNYRRAIGNHLFTYLFNTVVVTGASVLLIVVIAGAAAYALARHRFIGSSTLYLGVVAAYAAPQHALIVPIYLLLGRIGLLDSQVGLVLASVGLGVPFATILFYAFFLDFPRELEEAARLDRCSTLGTFFKVVAPLSLPAIASVAIIQGVLIWNDFLLPLVLISTENLKTLPLGLMSFRDEFTADWTAMMAAIVLAVLPMVFLYAVMQRQFMRSLAGLGK